jgi:hypothetical protein
MRWPFEEWGATAVFSGHDHAYERVMRDDNGDGVLLPYFTTGLGGHSRYSFGTPVSGSAVRYSADYGTMIIDASDTQIDFEFWSVAGGGRLIDSYGIAPTVGGDDSDVVYRWNAGTTTVAAIDGGKAWTADSSAIVGGPTNVFAGGITSLHSSVPKASVPVGIFAQERWDPPTGAEMGLEFGKGGLAAGIFAVRLFIGNGYQGTNAVGDRVFDVLVEGKTAFNDVDPVARFGQKAGGMLEWRGAITDGTIDIDFRHDVQNPLINGVEIAYLGDDAVPPEPPETGVVYRWNAGTATVAAIDGGKAWTADGSAIVGGPTNVFAGGITTLHSSVPKTSVPVGIFAQERWDPPTGAEMGLEFGKGGLAAGSYAVRLFIGNGYQGTDAVGDRVFDALVEGKTAFDDVDPVALFGQKAGGMLEWRGEVTDGTIDIDFRRGVENPLINGVEIAYLGDDLLL